MSQLTPEEKARIVEEEQLRAQTRAQLEANKVTPGRVIWGCLSFLIGLFVLYAIFSSVLT